LKERLGDDPGKPRDVVATLLLVVKKLDEMAQAGLYHPPLSPDAIRLRGANAVEVDAAPPPEPGKTLIVTESKYLAPECLFARPTEPKTVALSDVYSLGFIAYEWLLGGGNFEKQFPFEGAPQENFQWMQWHGDRAAAVKPPAEVCPWIPQPLSRLVEQMLAKDAAARPAAYPALIEELESIRKRIEDTHHVSNLTPAEHGSGTLAGKRSLGLRTMPAWQRILLLCAAAVVVVLVLFGLAGRGG
jgi:serine/threonine protein kinase